SGIRPSLAAVTGSAGSYPATTSSTTAASVTVRVMGPPTSRSRYSGTIPSRLVRPRVGRIPTSAVWDDGPRIELPVSVPSPTVPRFAATATAVPPLEPAGTRFRAYGLNVYPGCAEPTVSYGLNAHSAMFDLARTMAPASRSRRTM